MNPYTGFRDKAAEDSIRILSNVRRNIESSCLSRGLKVEHFYEWIKDQGVPQVNISRLRRYPPKGNINRKIEDTDHLIVISLAAVYMGITIEETMTKVLTPEQHKLRR